MTDRLPDADARRARFQCYLAATVFAACSGAMFFLPYDLSAVIRWLAAGFNGLLALALLIYARQIRSES